MKFSNYLNRRVFVMILGRFFLDFSGFAKKINNSVLAAPLLKGNIGTLPVYLMKDLFV